MTTTLVQIIGPILIAVGIGFLGNPKLHEKIVKEMESSESLTYIAGLFSMLIGLIIVLNHNIWDSFLTCLISFIGWSAIVKGAAFIIAPKILFKMSKPLMQNTALIKFALVVALVAGGYLSYVGYFM